MHSDVRGEYFDILRKPCVIPGFFLPPGSSLCKTEFAMFSPSWAYCRAAMGQRCQSISLGVLQPKSRTGQL